MKWTGAVFVDIMGIIHANVVIAGDAVGWCHTDTHIGAHGALDASVRVIGKRPPPPPPPKWQRSTWLGKRLYDTKVLETGDGSVRGTVGKVLT